MSRYAVSDLHGQLDLYNQIKEYINENDIVYALGDFGDRGPQPWRTLKAVLDDDQFIYLMGNHDWMLVEAMDEYWANCDEEGWCNVWERSFMPKGKIALLQRNGGLQTLEEWANEPNRIHYYWKLKNLPLELRLAAKDGDYFIHLTHAGYTPSHYDIQPGNVSDFVWDRHHFYDKWDNPQGHILIHGHTPCDYLTNQFDFYDKKYDMSKGYFLYDSGHKICIDRGAHYNNVTVLLNLDTLEAVEFKTKETVNDTEEN